MKHAASELAADLATLRRLDVRVRALPPATIELPWTRHSRSGDASLTGPSPSLEPTAKGTLHVNDHHHPEDSTTRLIDADAPRIDEDVIDCAPTHDSYAEHAMSREVVIDDWMHGRLPAGGHRHG